MTEFSPEEYAHAWNEWFNCCTSEKRQTGEPECSARSREVLYGIGRANLIVCDKDLADVLPSSFQKKGEVWRRFESFFWELEAVNQGRNGKCYKQALRAAYEVNASDGIKVQTSKFYRYFGSPKGVFGAFRKNLLLNETIEVRRNKHGDFDFFVSLNARQEDGAALEEILPEMIPDGSACKKMDTNDPISSTEKSVETDLLEKAALKIMPDIKQMLSKPLLVAVSAKKREISLADEGLEKFTGVRKSRLNEIFRKVSFDMLMKRIFPNDKPAWGMLKMQCEFLLCNMVEKWLHLPENSELLRFLETKASEKRGRAANV